MWTVPVRVFTLVDKAALWIIAQTLVILQEQSALRRVRFRYRYEMFFGICALLHGNGMTVYSVEDFAEILNPTLAVKHPQNLIVAELLEVKNYAIGVKGPKDAFFAKDDNAERVSFHSDHKLTRIYLGLSDVRVKLCRARATYDGKPNDYSGKNPDHEYPKPNVVPFQRN